MFDDELEGCWVYEVVSEQRCAGAKAVVTCVTSKRMGQGVCFKSIARSAVVLHFLTGFRTEQVALCILLASSFVHFT